MAEGDISRGGFLDILGNLLDRGVQVVLANGDRDYVGNCKCSYLIFVSVFSKFFE